MKSTFNLKGLSAQSAKKNCLLFLRFSSTVRDNARKKLIDSSRRKLFSKMEGKLRSVSSNHQQYDISQGINDTKVYTSFHSGYMFIVPYENNISSQIYELKSRVLLIVDCAMCILREPHFKQC